MPFSSDPSHWHDFLSVNESFSRTECFRIVTHTQKQLLDDLETCSHGSQTNHTQAFLLAVSLKALDVTEAILDSSGMEFLPADSR